MRAFLLVTALVVALGAAPAHADPQAYTLDPAHTEVGFSVLRFGFNHVLGRFDTVSGEMTIDEAAPEHSTVHAVIDTASFNSGNCTRDMHLKSANWLNVAQNPNMEFRSTAVHVVAAHHAQVTGDLTLNGQTHPVTLDVTLNQIGPSPAGGQRQAGFSATGVIKRTQFGVGAQVPTTLIGDDVAITIEALASPGSAAQTAPLPRAQCPAPPAAPAPAH